MILQLPHQHFVQAGIALGLALFLALGSSVAPSF
jgi:hypothetical protein